jgi:D-hexose-6-phosphate mutarotase
LTWYSTSYDSVARITFTITLAKKHFFMTTLDALHHTFAIPGVANIVLGNGDLPCVDITNTHAKARIYLHGAHVTHFQPHGADPVLWMSANSRFANNAPIRGGIPICWPWFGPNPQNASLPAHGFARTTSWILSTIRSENNGDTTVILSLQDSEATRALWPHSFQLTMTIRVGNKLDLQLSSKNTGNTSFTYAEALHSYFAVQDVRNISIAGLQGVKYLDKVSGQSQQVSSAPIIIGGETDRVYHATTSLCTVHDTKKLRDIIIAKQGSQSTVVWNPWIAKAAAMADFGNEEWPSMVCVEIANALDDVITLTPEASHTMQATISVKSR